MAKVTFCCDNHANIHSELKETFDTVNDLGLADNEWEGLSNDEKFKIVENWEVKRLQIAFIEED